MKKRWERSSPKIEHNLSLHEISSLCLWWYLVSSTYLCRIVAQLGRKVEAPCVTIEPTQNILSCIMRYWVAFQRPWSKLQVMQPKPAQRRELWNLAVPRSKVFMPPTPMDTKDWGKTGTWAPEPFSKIRVHCPGRSSADFPYHKWSDSKVLQLQLALPALLHTPSP